MKRIFLFIIFIFSYNNIFANNIDKLPLESKELIRTIFPKSYIRDVSIINRRNYKVELDNDIIFHFNQKGELTEINGLELEPIPYHSMPKEAYRTFLDEVKNPKIINIEKKKELFYIKTYDKFDLYQIVVKSDGALIKKEEIIRR